jgi:hypothetical protein
MMQQTFGTANNDIAKLDPEGVVPMDGKECPIRNKTSAVSQCENRK